jgi:hypothetical protein
MARRTICNVPGPRLAGLRDRLERRRVGRERAEDERAEDRALVLRPAGRAERVGPRFLRALLRDALVAT